MEDALALIGDCVDMHMTIVLILVVMEDALAPSGGNKISGQNSQKS